MFDEIIFDVWEWLDMLIVVDGMWEMVLLIDVFVFVIGLLLCAEMGWCDDIVGIDCFGIWWFCERGVDGIIEMILLLVEVGGWVGVIVWIVGDVFFFVKLVIKFGFVFRMLFDLWFVTGWCKDEEIAIVVRWEEEDGLGDEG